MTPTYYNRGPLAFEPTITAGRVYDDKALLVQITGHNRYDWAASETDNRKRLR